MALTAILTRTAVTSTGAQSTWQDGTVYGGANPVRPDVAVFLTAYKVTESTTDNVTTLVETALAVTAFDPHTATTFTTNNDVDGWHKYYFSIIPIWKVGTTFNQYDLCYDTGVPGFYQYINSTPSAGNAVTNTTYWSPVTDPNTIIANTGTSTQSNNLVYTIVNKILDYQTSKCLIKAAINNAKENCSDSCDTSAQTYKFFTRIFDLLTTMRLDEAQELWVAGERAARLAEKYCDDCGCLSR